MPAEHRHSRHAGLFGSAGQRRIRECAVAVVGLGGLGSHVVQQLAYLGVGRFLLFDGDAVELSNLNRLIGAGEDDVGRLKSEVAARQVAAIDSSAAIERVDAHFEGDEHAELLAQADVLFGCVDEDMARLQLLTAASALALPYLDLASDVTPGGEFGGRVVFAKDGERCLSCLGELDQHALARAQMSPEQRAADDAIYGVERAALDEAGPSVVSVNGAVASLAVTEFFVWMTGMREPRGYLTYRGDRATVGTRADPERGYCHYCMDLWGSRRRS